MKKYIFMVLAGILCLQSFAQNSFPVAVKSIDTVRSTFKDKNWILANEGDIFSFGDDTHTGTNASPTVGALIYNYPLFTKPGMLTNFKEFTVNADGPCRMVISINRVANIPGSLERVSQRDYKVFGASGGSYTLKDLDIYESGSITVNVYATTTTDPRITVGGSAVQVTSDFNWNAKYTWFAIGDSRQYSAGGLVGGTGGIANSGKSNYHQRLMNMLRSEGKDIRLISKGVSGITAAAYKYRILSGELDAMIRNASVVSIELGTNDAAAATAAASNYDANMQLIIDYIYALNPNVDIILEGIYGTSVTNVLNNSPGYRTIMASYPGLAKYAGKHLQYVDFLTSVPNPTAANDNNFTETAFGSQLHGRWDTAGLAMANQEAPVMRNTWFYTHR